MKVAAPRRGDVWLADVPEDKRRPVLVLTRNPLGAVLNAVIVAPVTSTIRGLPTEVHLGKQEGLARDSVANLSNTSLVNRRSLVRRLGRVDATTMEATCRALAEATGC